MNSVTLTINIDPQYLGDLRDAGQFVVIAQEVTQKVKSADTLLLAARALSAMGRTDAHFAAGKTDASSARYSVAWLSLVPFPQISVEWTPEYRFYLSHVRTTPDSSSSGEDFPLAMNVMTSHAPPPQALSVYDKGASVFSDAVPCAGLGSGFYAIQSQENPQAIYVGLAQAAQVDGTDTLPVPICNTAVLNNQIALFKPTGRFAVYLSTCATPGTITEAISGSSYRFGADNAKSPIIVQYDGSKFT